jgi:hypothetical protein
MVAKYWCRVRQAGKAEVAVIGKWRILIWNLGQKLQELGVYSTKPTGVKCECNI